MNVLTSTVSEKLSTITPELASKRTKELNMGDVVSLIKVATRSVISVTGLPKMSFREVATREI